MEKEFKSINNINKNKIVEKNKGQTKGENYEMNDFNFLFEEKKDINNPNFFQNLMIEKSEQNENIFNDCDEDNKEENSVFKAILDDLDKNIEINVKDMENENKNECQEILDILKYPLSDKNIRGGISPFKPLIKPKKISMIGRVFSNIPLDENINNTNNNTNEDTISNGNNDYGKILSGNI